MVPNDGRVISNFIVQALKNKSLTIYGEGLQTRSFCYVDDLIEGMIKLMNSNFIGPVNIGNPEEFTISQLAEIIRERINPELKFIYKKLPEDDPPQRKPCIKLAKEKLNWEPKVNLQDGLSRTIKFFSEKLRSEGLAFSLKE